MTENIYKMEWKSIDKILPDNTCGAYFISGHEWFGIGIWENKKGWTRGFIGEWPNGDTGDYFNQNDDYLNEEVMWWCEIDSNYPYYGIKMEESELCKKFFQQKLGQPHTGRST